MDYEKEKIHCVSVVMPAFNASGTIRRAIDSVISQTLTDWELLVVDDGSTDDTGQIVNEYASKDSRIKAIHKENGGVASARQKGMDAIHGEYVIHFDADDYADSRMFEEMYTTAKKNNSDMVIADFFVLEPGKDKLYFPQYFESGKSSNVIISILKGRLLGVLWNKLIRVSAFAQQKARFEPGIDYCEDNLILAKLLKNDALKVTYHKGAYYVYCRDRKESMTRKYDNFKYNVLKEYYNKLSEVLSEPEFQEALTYNYFYIRFEAYQNGFASLVDFDDLGIFPLRFLRHAPASKSFRVRLMLFRVLHLVGYKKFY